MSVRDDYEALRAVVPGSLTPWRELDRAARETLRLTARAWTLPAETVGALRATAPRPRRALPSEGDALLAGLARWHSGD